MKTKVYPLLLFLICFAFFTPFLINNELLTIKDNDLGRTYIPLFNFFRNSFYENLSIPIWRSDQLIGESLIANPLSSLVYPANVLFLVFPTNFASILYYFVHFVLAAIFTFLLARSFKLSQLPSFAAALFYAFSTKMLLHLSAGHITMIAAFSYFPLFFLSSRMVIKKTKAAWIVWGSFSLASMYITYPTIFYYAVIFMVIYCFYRLFIPSEKTLAFMPGMKRNKENILLSLESVNRWIFSLGSLFLILILTLGLSAIVIFPQAEFAPLSTRSALRLEDVALPLWNLKRFLTSLIFPYLNFSDFDHESFLYLGVIPSFLVLAGFARLPLAKKVFIAIVGILTLFFIAGLSTPLFEIAYKYLPFLKYTRITTRLWFAVAQVVALLAAYALEKIKPRKVVFLILALFLIESFYIGYRKIKEVPYLSFENDQIYQYLASDPDLFRVYCTTYCFNPQLISKYQIQVLHGESPIQDARIIKFLENAGNYHYPNFAVIFPPYQVWQKENPPKPSAYFLGLANVKYIASTYKILLPDLSFIDKFDNIYLYLNKKYKPRVYFEDFNDPVGIVNYSPNSISLMFASSDDYRNLILSENFYPDWFATVNHQKIKIERWPPIFRKIVVPPNTQSLELRYQPDSLIFGKTITLATLTFLILWYIRKRQLIKGVSKA